MTSFISKVGSFFGRVLLRVAGVVHAADKDIDVDLPKIEAVLQKGESIATLVPGIGPELEGFLNVGIDLLGGVKTTVDATDSVLQKLSAEVQTQLTETNVSVLLIPTEVYEAAKELLATYEAEIAAATTSVKSLTPAPASPEATAASPVPESTEAPVPAEGEQTKTE